jgi:hypothetical protein
MKGSRFEWASALANGLQPCCFAPRLGCLFALKAARWKRFASPDPADCVGGKRRGQCSSCCRSGSHQATLREERQVAVVPLLESARVTRALVVVREGARVRSAPLPSAHTGEAGALLSADCTTREGGSTSPGATAFCLAVGDERFGLWSERELPAVAFMRLVVRARSGRGAVVMGARSHRCFERAVGFIVLQRGRSGGRRDWATRSAIPFG